MRIVTGVEMTKEVLLSIAGSQFLDTDRDSIEMVTVANYYKRNGHHFVLYDEVPEGEDSVIRNTLRFDETFFEMTKKGGVNAQLLFNPQQSNSTYYETPVGPMNMNITTMNYLMEEKEGYIEVYIKYVLEINYSYSSENEIWIRIAPR